MARGIGGGEVRRVYTDEGILQKIILDETI